LRPQHGFSLLEVLVAAAVMGSALAGLAALLLAAVSGTVEAAQRGHATLLAGSMTASVQLAPSGVAAFIHPGEDAFCPQATVCMPDRFASASVAEWRDRIANSLPGGQGVVCFDSTPWDGTAGDPSCDGAPPLAVKVFWTGPPSARSASQRVVQVVP